MDLSEFEQPETPSSVPLWRRPRVLAAAFIALLFAVFVLDTSKASGLGPFATVATSILGILISWVLTFLILGIPVLAVSQAIRQVRTVRQFVHRFFRKAPSDPVDDALTEVSEVLAETLFDTKLALWTSRSVKATAIVALGWSIALFFARKYGVFDLVFNPLAMVAVAAYGVLVLGFIAFVAGRVLDLVEMLGRLLFAPFKWLLGRKSDR